MSEQQSTVNIPLLRTAVEWVEAQAVLPEIDREWDQRMWRIDAEERAERLTRETPATIEAMTMVAPHCGTTYCVAGYIGQSLDPRYATTNTVNGVHVSAFAADALGIPYHDDDDDDDAGDRLFFAFNTAKDVRRIAEDIAGERL